MSRVTLVRFVRTSVRVNIHSAPALFQSKKLRGQSLLTTPRFFSSFPSNEGAAVPVQTVTTPAVDVGVAVVQAAAEGHWVNVEACIKFLTVMNEVTGLPWWLTIVTTTIAVRGALLPLMAKSFRNNAGLLKSKPEMEAVNAKFAQMDKNGQIYNTQDKQFAILEIFKKHNCNPFAAFLVPLISAPMFITFFFTLRSMAAETTLFVNGGALWFQNLAVMDPYYILPVLSSLSMLGAIEMGGETGQKASQLGMMKHAMRAMAVGMIPFIYDFPAAVFCYWVTSNSFSIFQAVFFKQPAVKAFFRIPSTTTEDVANPYVEKVESIQKETASNIRYFERKEKEQDASSSKKKTRRT